PEMLFRYRARNYPETLSLEERGTWDEYRNWRLTDPAGGASIVLDDYLAEIERLSFAAETSDAERALLEQLMEYAEQVVPDGA
ncbi:MAG: exodeoxyribonuclease I, partial [Neisseriaceae bacterium]